MLFWRNVNRYSGEDDLTETIDKFLDQLDQRRPEHIGWE